MTSAGGDDCSEEAATTTKDGRRPLRPSPARRPDPNLRWEEEEELAFQAEASRRPPPASEGLANDTATMARMKHDGVFMIAMFAISSSWLLWDSDESRA